MEQGINSSRPGAESCQEGYPMVDARVPLKVYGSFEPMDDALFNALRALVLASAAAGYCADADTEGIVTRRSSDGNGGGQIAFEGLAFPLDDVVRILTEHAGRLRLNGRLDYLDIEEWRITRTVWEQGTRTQKSGSLNAALDYSGF